MKVYTGRKMARVMALILFLVLMSLVGQGQARMSRFSAVHARTRSIGFDVFARFHKKFAFTSRDSPSTVILVASVASIIALAVGGFLILRVRAEVKKNAFSELFYVVTNCKDFVATGNWRRIDTSTVYLLGLLSCFVIAVILGHHISGDVVYVDADVSQSKVDVRVSPEPPQLPAVVLPVKDEVVAREKNPAVSLLSKAVDVEPVHLEQNVLVEAESSVVDDDRSGGDVLVDNTPSAPVKETTEPSTNSKDVASVPVVADFDSIVDETKDVLHESVTNFLRKHPLPSALLMVVIPTLLLSFLNHHDHSK